MQAVHYSIVEEPPVEEDEVRGALRVVLVAAITQQNSDDFPLGVTAHLCARVAAHEQEGRS